MDAGPLAGAIWEAGFGKALDGFGEEEASAAPGHEDACLFVWKKTHPVRHAEPNVLESWSLHTCVDVTSTPQ